MFGIEPGRLGRNIECRFIGLLGIPLSLIILASGVRPQDRNEDVRLELVAMEKEDQDTRMRCTNLVAEEQVRCLTEISISIDEPNAKRLEEIFDQIGFPNTAKVGKDGFQAFMIILQHAPTDRLRLKCRKAIRRAFENKELPPMDFANFVDRLRLHQGKKQLYGAGFEFKDGKLVMSPTKDPKNLDKRRAKIGLPSLAEYVKVLEEMYHLKADIPK